MEKIFEEIKGNYGFGCMRLPKKTKWINKLPVIGKRIVFMDYDKLNPLVDAYMAAGFNYYDVARSYMRYFCEPAMKKALVKRYPRDSFVLANKLTTHYFQTEKQIRPLFMSQLRWCGVKYFDFYFMHAMDAQKYAKYVATNAFGVIGKLKEEGRIRHIGISFHDTAEVLEKILSEQPSIEVVQIQLNYVDFDDPSIQSRKCLEVCRKYNKPVFVMEPSKGGTIINHLPDEAKKVFDDLGGGSYASYAIRFAASQPSVRMVLSGVNQMEFLQDNLSYMKDFKPLNEEEMKAVKEVCRIFKSQKLIPCTACRYCTDGCPQHISIPDLFALMNQRKQFDSWNLQYYYDEIHTKHGGKASSCIKCGKCETSCPQHLPIRKLLEGVAEEFEKK